VRYKWPVLQGVELLRSRGPRRGRILVFVAVGAAGLVASGCGASAQTSAPTLIASGQIPKADLPLGGKHGGGASSAATIPLAKQNPTTALFTAIGTFQSCLTGMGQSFIGIPDPSKGNAPVNNPDYLKALSSCAAKSNILQALKTAQSAQDNLTPTQVKQENKDYLRWRTCMISRGWQIPPPTPNQKGLLFSFGGTGGEAGQFKPPPGQNLLSSPDLQACAAKAQAGSS
jgi:hypothetical protein